MTKVSIITPVYNSAKYIGDTLESVLKQSFTDWEMILVDAGSKDDSIQIINQYIQIDSRFKLIHNKNDKGPAHARYIGIKEAQGYYIAFLDADDLWNIDKLKIQVQYMESNLIEFSYTLCRELQKDSKSVSVLLPTKNMFTYKSYLGSRGIYALTVMIKKELLVEEIIKIWHKNSFDETLWWILIMKSGVNAYLVPYDLALYRLSNDQLSSKRFRTIKNVYSLYDYFPEINLLNRNIYFLKYLYDSFLRHFKLKFFTKLKIDK